MQVVNPQLIHGKKILLRLDIDVPLRQAQGHGQWQIAEDFRLRQGLPTLKLCIENTAKVIIIGHLGRPFKTVEEEKKGNPPELSAKPVFEWYKKQLGLDIEFVDELEKVASSNSKLIMLENTRFFHGEMEGDIDFAHKLASLGEVFVNEAFASYNPAASTTMLPTILPHFCGLRFSEEVKKLTAVREHPKKPFSAEGANLFIAIMGGAKVADKLPVITVLAQKADAVLVGGKLISEIREQNLRLPKNVMVGMLNEDGFDIAEQTTSAWGGLISKAAEIVWNGPLGKFEDIKNDQTQKIAEMILNSNAEIVIGGGDSVAALSQYDMLAEAEKKAFVSTGGGAMLKFLTDGTLATIEALK